MQRSFRTDYTKLYCTLVYKGLVPYTITILCSTQVGITVVCYTMLCILLYLTLHYLTPPGVSADEVAINTSNAFQESMWKCNKMLYKFDCRFTYNSLAIPVGVLRGRCVGRCDVLFCAHRTHVLYKYIRACMLTKATLY